MSQPRNKSPEEQVDLIDAENRVVGQAARQRVRSENLLHRGVAILVTNARHEVYVHQRTATKDLFPSYYDMFVGGVVAAGETYERSAVRELAEELGIAAAAEPELMFEHLYEGPENRSWIRAFRVEWNGPIRHQPEEVAWGEWIPLADLESWAREHPIVPDGLEVFQRYLEWSRSR